jgi:hypothetical protein
MLTHRWHRNQTGGSDEPRNRPKIAEGCAVVKFTLGHMVATPGALRLLEEHGISPITLLSRHAQGDWGVVDEDDWKENDLSVVRGFRILSSYEVGSEKCWIITEADRSSTTLLLPSEY